MRDCGLPMDILTENLTPFGFVVSANECELGLPLEKIEKMQSEKFISERKWGLKRTYVYYMSIEVYSSIWLRVIIVPN